MNAIEIILFIWVVLLTIIVVYTWAVLVLNHELNRRTNIIAHECLEKITKITRGKEQEEA